MLTRRGWFILAAAVVLAFAGRLLGIIDLFVIATAGIVLVGGASIFVRAARTELLATRRLYPPRVHAGGSSRVELSLRNDGSRRAPVVTVRDPFDGGVRWARFLVAPLAPGETARAAYRLPTDQRGVFDLGPLKLQVADPFGIASVTIEAAPRTQLTVYPRIDAIQPLPLARDDDADAAADHLHTPGGAGEDFYTLRPYVEGDDVRHIHWSSTAKLGEPMVRQNEVPWLGRAAIVVDTRARTNTAASFELVLSAAASILNACWRRRSVLRVLTTGGFDSGFAAGQGHVEAILEHLAAAERSRSGDLLRVLARLQSGAAGGGLAVVTTGMAPPSDLESLGRIAGRFGSLTTVVFERSAFEPSAGPPRAPASRGRGGARDGRDAVPRGLGSRHAPDGCAPMNVTAPRPEGILGRPEVAHVALFMLTASAGIGLARLFSDASVLPRVLLVAGAVHACTWFCRERGWPLIVSAIVTTAVAVELGLLTTVPEATTYGVATPFTFETASRALDTAFQQFRSVSPPVSPLPGFVLASLAGVAISGFLSDWAAFRMRATAEACLPSFSLFVFSSALGPGRLLGIATGCWIAAFLLFLVAHETSSGARAAAWFASRSRGGGRAIARAGAVLTTVAIVVGVVLGPQLPGARASAIVSFRGNGEAGEGGSRTTVSPLVDIRGRLVSHTGLETFSVKAPQRSYWRLTSLDVFDGQIWQSDDNYRPVRRQLASGDDVVDGAATVDQEFTISALSSIWLPAAYRPVSVAGTRGLSFNDDSGSLISANATSDGLAYQVRSAVRTPTAAELRAAPGVTSATHPGFSRYFALPSVPRVAIQRAMEVTARATTQYDHALALQNWFRTTFEYDLDIGSGHDENAIARFLRQRRGYCEQFAGTFAVMARLLGIPTRVAIGFTTGEVGEDGRFHVRDEHAHAWPEVYFAGIGWVPFEPTPGRGAPGAEGYTGVREEQVSSENRLDSTTVPPVVPTTEPESATPSTTLPSGEQQLDTTGNEGESDDVPLPLRLAIAVGIALAVASAGSAAAASARAVRTRRRRTGARTPTARVLVAWEETGEALALAGAPKNAGETPREFTHRAAQAARLPSSVSTVLRSLGDDVAAASYAPDVVGADVATRSLAAATVVERTLRDRASWRQRLWWTIDPRPLWRRAR